MEIPYTIEARPDTGIYNAKLGIWLFLASEVMLFGGLFSAYVLLRVGAEPDMWPHGWLNVTLGTIMELNTFILWAAIALGIAQIPFIINLFHSISHGEKVTSDNPWQATTLDWQTPTPPPHGNFEHPPHVAHGPYEYSAPGHATDFTPQNEPAQAPAPAAAPQAAH